MVLAWYFGFLVFLVCLLFLTVTVVLVGIRQGLSGDVG